MPTHGESLTSFWQCYANFDRLHINIGPNTSPLGLSLKEEDKDLGVLLVEANLGIANMLRETRQKKHPGRIFVINCAVAGAPLAGSFHSFHSFNKDGLSSSLAQPARSKMGDLPSWATGPAVNITYGPGAGGVDFVPVLSLDSLLDAIPNRIEISFLKTDTQGFDFKVVQSAKRTKLRRIKMLMTETYMDKALYVDVQNDLETDWIPHMRKMGFSLDNPPSAKKTEHDAIWSRID